MGLFSGGGFFGKIGEVLGTNTDRAEKSIERAADAQVERLQEGVDQFRTGFGQTEADLQPFQLAGLEALPSLSASSTLDGFGANINDIFSSGALSGLIDERQRASNTALASSGLTRSGGAARAAADIPAELAFQLEGLLNNRQSDLVGMGQNVSTNLGSLRHSLGAGIANLLSGQGSAESASILGQQQARTGRNENILGAVTGGIGALGKSGGGGMEGLGKLLLGVLSDVRLKENIKPLGMVGPLMYCEWDWIDGVEAVASDYVDLQDQGFLAQDVAEHYPELTGDFNGFITIKDYDGLIRKLIEVH